MEISGIVPAASLSLRTPGQEARPGAVFPAQSVGRAEDPADRPVEPPDQSERPQDQERPRGELSDEERRELEELKARDRQVRANEAARLGVAGPHAQGGARFETERGADGRSYAVEGQVKFDTSAVPDDLQATARKMAQVRRAILASGDLSPEERALVAEASRRLVHAQLALARENQEMSFSELEESPDLEKRELVQQLSDRFDRTSGASQTGGILDIRV